MYSRYGFVRKTDTSEIYSLIGITYFRDYRFAAIRNFFELFNKNSLMHVIPSECLAIDETLYAIRNQISIKQYKLNKPAKYGLLFKPLNYAHFPYTYTYT